MEGVPLEGYLVGDNWWGTPGGIPQEEYPCSRSSERAETAGVPCRPYLSSHYNGPRSETVIMARYGPRTHT